MYIIYVAIQLNKDKNTLRKSWKGEMETETVE